MARRAVGRSTFAGRSGIAKPRRQTEWIGTTGGIADLVTGTTGRIRLSLTAAQLAPLVPFTIIRTIATWFTAIDADFVTNQDYLASLGGIVTTESARVTGVGAMPKPLTNIADDTWFLHFTYIQFLEEVLSSNAAVITGMTHNIDNRAMRKVEDGQAISFVEENLGTDDCQTALSVRMLCKLH